MQPTFLSLAEVMDIHQDQLSRYGGSPGIRDLGLLKSALAMPCATYGGQFLHTDLYQMAAAYLFHVVKNHPFIDGNKRVGAVASLVFLDLNGHNFDAPEEKLVATVLSVSQGQLDKPEVSLFLKHWSQ